VLIFVVAAFTYIIPGHASFHPADSMVDGQNFVKLVYETLRSSPQWDQILFLFSFDENGGFGDHVPPPTGVPAGDNLTYTETAPDGKPVTLDFTRLGARVPTYAISPWVAKGAIEHKGRNSGGVYTHTSMIAFLANLWGLEFLTPRVAFSSTFEHLILDKKRGAARSNCVLTGDAVEL